MMDCESNRILSRARILAARALSERLPLGCDIHIGGANFWLARLLGCDTTGFDIL
jgi:hypothetical protein